MFSRSPTIGGTSALARYRVPYSNVMEARVLFYDSQPRFCRSHTETRRLRLPVDVSPMAVGSAVTSMECEKW